MRIAKSKIPMTREDGQDKISKEYSAPSQKMTCGRRSYDGCDRIEARMEKLKALGRWIIAGMVG